MLIALEGEELVQAGYMAEDMFVRQMKAHRRALGLSQAELADRVMKLGGALYQQTIAKIESGQRALRLSEADLLAQALGATVAEMLSGAIGTERPFLEDLEARQEAAAQRAAELEKELARAEIVVDQARRALHASEAQLARISALRHEVAREYAGVSRELIIAEDREITAGGNLSIGRQLQRGRVRAGMSADRIAASLRIPLSLVFDVERNNIAKLSYGTARAFIRMIAQTVDMDPKPLLEQYENEYRPPLNGAVNDR